MTEGMKQREMQLNAQLMEAFEQERDETIDELFWKAFRKEEVPWRAHREWPELQLPLIGGYFGPRDDMWTQEETDTIMEIVFERFCKGRKISAILGIPNTATPLAMALQKFMPWASLLEMDKETGKLTGKISGRVKNILFVDNALTTAASLLRGYEAVEEAGLTVAHTVVLYSWQLGGSTAVNLSGRSVSVLRRRKELFDSWVRTKKMSEASRRVIDENCDEFLAKATRRIIFQVP